MKFAMETEPLPPSRPKDWRKHPVTIACATAIVYILILILYIKLETESGPRYEPEFRDPDGPTELPRTSQPVGSPVVGGSCGGLLEGNNGSLHFVNESKQQDVADTSSSSCLWIIHLRNETNIRFTLNALGEDAFLNLCSGDQLASCSTSSYTIMLNSTQVGSSFEFHGKTLMVILSSSSASVGFSWNFVTTEATDLTNFKAKETAVGDGMETSTEGIPNLTTSEGTVTTESMQATTDLTNFKAIVTAIGDGMETSTAGIANLTTSEGILEGIIAGTGEGVVIIALDSLEQRTISSMSTYGVAFNWESRKVYWIHYGVGIKTADLDGSSVEVVIADTSFLCGIAVDQVTGNFYYGVRGSNPGIRVCDSMGKKCATVVSGVNNVGSDIYDIALSPSEGLMFWSNPGDKKSVSRANMDGTNLTVIISENIWGLFLHEFEEKLYWANFYDQSIEQGDFNGLERNVLLNTTNYPKDIVVNGDTMYFGGHAPNGVYSFDSNRKVSTIANTRTYVNQIALYGRNKTSSRQNPCKNSPCANLCVLTRVSYTCL